MAREYGLLDSYLLHISFMEYSLFGGLLDILRVDSRNNFNNNCYHTCVLSVNDENIERRSGELS